MTGANSSIHDSTTGAPGTIRARRAGKGSCARSVSVSALRRRRRMKDTRRPPWYTNKKVSQYNNNNKKVRIIIMQLVTLTGGECGWKLDTA